MSEKILITKSSMDAIGDSIRDRNGLVTKYLPSEMSAAIEAIPNSYSASDEDKIVKNGALVAQTARETAITENGTYDTTENDEVTVNVSGSGGPLNWNEPISCNWDYANVINTRGQSRYSASGYTNGVINGHNLYLAVLDVVTGGLNLSQYTTGTTGYLIQRFNTNITQKLLGNQMVFSTLVDGQIHSITFTPTSAIGSLGSAVIGNTLRMSAAIQSGPQLEVNIAALSGAGSELIQAIKLELGDTQTLAKESASGWELIKGQTAVMESIKGPLFLVAW